MPSRTDTAGHTKAFIYPIIDSVRSDDLWVHSRTRQPPDHDDCPKLEDQLYPGSSKVGVGVGVGVGVFSLFGDHLPKQPRHAESIPGGGGGRVLRVKSHYWMVGRTF